MSVDGGLNRGLGFAEGADHGTSDHAGHRSVGSIYVRYRRRLSAIRAQGAPSEIAYDYLTAKATPDAIGHREIFGLNVDPSHVVWHRLDEVGFMIEFAEHLFHAHVERWFRVSGVRRRIPRASRPHPPRGWSRTSIRASGVIPRLARLLVLAAIACGTRLLLTSPRVNCEYPFNVALSRASRDGADTVIAVRLPTGGTEPKEAQECGFMYSRDLEPPGRPRAEVRVHERGAAEGSQAYLAEQGEVSASSVKRVTAPVLRCDDRRLLRSGALCRTANWMP